MKNILDLAPKFTLSMFALLVLYSTIGAQATFWVLYSIGALAIFTWITVPFLQEVRERLNHLSR